MSHLIDDGTDDLTDRIRRGQQHATDRAALRDPWPPKWFTAATVATAFTAAAAVGSAITHTGPRTVAIMLTAATIAMSTQWIGVRYRRMDQAAGERIAEVRHRELVNQLEQLVTKSGPDESEADRQRAYAQYGDLLAKGKNAGVIPLDRDVFSNSRRNGSS